MQILLLRIVYVANILVAGMIAYSAISSPARASVSVFQQAYAPTEVMRLVGCLWLGIAVLSLLGLYRPLVFSPVLLLQVIYKGTWLLVVALPAIKKGYPYPTGMAAFFLVWVVILPLVIPWKAWFGV